MTLPRQIRLLHLEDSFRDAELVAATLESGGLTANIDQVDTWAKYNTSLDKEPYDLILCDYNLPGYDGLAALELAQEKQPGTPVIMISGSIGEEEAVQCLQVGATDYLLKGRLERLVPAVSRALKESDQLKQRRVTEENLRRSEERFRQFAEHSTDVVWLVEFFPDRFVYVSPAVESIWGLSPAEICADARVWLASVHAEDRERVTKAWDAGLSSESGVPELEYRIVRPDGTCRWVLQCTTALIKEDGVVQRIGGTTKDITERKEFEARVLRSQRLESIGTLAGGIAHDLNNTLVPIMMSAGLIRMKDASLAPLVDTIEASAQRAASMVQQLLTFAKGIEGTRVPIESHHLLTEIDQLMQSTFPKTIQVSTHCPKSLPPVLGDATQLHQVLINLCINARDAMPNGGALKVEAETIEITPAAADSFQEAKAGSYVVWHVTDTGQGIPPETLERIFEPFFTTKGKSGGTGLGLSTVNGIVKSHGGFVHVYSTLDRGTTFSVHLPAAAASTQRGAAETHTALPPLRGTGKTILVLDDDDDVRHIMRTALKSLDFKVITSANGMEALHHAGENRATLAAVITDLHMPGMDGLTFVNLLRRILPESKIVVTSGRLDEASIKAFEALKVDAILDKPFSQQTLESALRSVIDWR